MSGMSGAVEQLSGPVDVVEFRTDEVGGRIEMSCVVLYENDKMPSNTIRTSIDARWADLVVPGPEHLVPPLMVLAARLGDDLRIDAPIEAEWADACRRAHGLQASWWGWRPAGLSAPVRGVRRRRRRRGRGLCFTCGVDSWGVYLSQRGTRRAPTHLISVDGDVHWSDPLRRARLDHVRATADRLGLPLVEVRTDIRSTIDPHSLWGRHTHGGVLAGVGRLLSGGIGSLTISPSNWWPDATPYGSHPGLDPLWSTPSLAIHHPDADEPRHRRILRIAADPLAASTLQVCLQQGDETNCGRCNKCLDTLTALTLSGRSGWEGRFVRPFDPAAIGDLDPIRPAAANRMLELCDEVGLAADALRQRWETVERIDDPAITYRHAARQARLRVTVEGRPPTPDEALAIGRALARHGLRVDHGTGAAEVLDRAPLELRVTDAVVTDATGRTIDELVAAGDVPACPDLAFDPDREIADIDLWRRRRRAAVGLR